MGRDHTSRDANNEIEIAFDYHQATHNQDSIQSTSGSEIEWNADWRRSKDYGFATPILLEPPSEDKLGAPASVMLSTGSPRAAEDGQLTIEDIGLILYHSYGITGTKRHGDAVFRLRSAPSAGAVYPVELYVLNQEIKDLPAGLYHYNPERFTLLRLRSGDCRGQLASHLARNSDDPAKIYLLVTVMFWRPAEKFGDPSYRYSLLDTGHVISNFIAVLDGLGYGARIAGAFHDEATNSLIHVSDDLESMMAVVEIGKGDPCADEGKQSNCRTELSGFWGPRPARTSPHPQMHCLHSSGHLWEDQLIAMKGEKLSISAGQSDPGNNRNRSFDRFGKLLANADLGEVLARRRSSRGFNGDKIDSEKLQTILASLPKPYGADWINSSTGNDGIIYDKQAEIFVAVNAVSEMENGLYRCEYESGGLHPVFLENARERILAACGGQALAAKAGAVLFIAPKLRSFLEKFGNRGYRYAGMHSGILGGRAYLTATALGVGVTGIASVDDKVANELVSADGRDTAVFYAIALGHDGSRRK